MIVTLVNGVYVFEVNNALPYQQEVFLVLAVSLFKIFWSTEVVLKGLGSYLTSTLNIKLSVNVLIGLLLFNNIVAPYLAESLFSPNCFLYVIDSPAPVSTTVQES